MKILGLTGSIGMGKSTAAAMFRHLGVPVHDADATTHELMAPDGLAFDPIARVFPDVIVNGRIDRQALGKIAFSNPDVLKTLETILHPLVRAAENRFLAAQRRLGRKLVVLDIPLLYETSGEKRCDHVAVVSAPGFIQRQRVLSREGMTETKFSAILSKQMPDIEKRKRADFIIPTGLGRAVTFQYIQGIIDQLS
ncbi:dephospho-CoA kinase [Thalassospira tepidiphila]|uniref:Dephospho-CoA kinase n=2 Tax=Thalassospira tepidiphila TaxID=393657 RepID=A0A853L344_9PROT|nr:dephospho-CoA kinase [Thalassospira tepidiphila]NJB73282.1 dephospho-CoA kinase [Thalassospira tepidiphila]OAZ11006.1 dephospho-CoA kinase [Thalassospira tepidiphila MCCC 1A03514]